MSNENEVQWIRMFWLRVQTGYEDYLTDLNCIELNDIPNKSKYWVVLNQEWQLIWNFRNFVFVINLI